MPAFQSILTALGWSLLDSTWQMAAVWIAFYALTAGNMRISAAGKHNLAFMFVAIGSGWFFYSFIHFLKNEPVSPIASGFIPLSQSVNSWIPYLTLVYLLILAVRFIQYGNQCWAQNKNKSGKSIAPVLQSFTEKHARLMGITRSVQVYLSDLAETAVTGGLFRPWILLPVTLVTRLTPQQMESILIHELFHIRRNDYLINIFMSCFRSIFFFNPFAHLFYKTIERERELACDDGVLERDYPPALYAEALYCLEKFRQVQSGFFIAADGNKPWLLMERIRRVLGQPEFKKNQSNHLVFLALFAAFVLFGLQQKTPVQNGINQVTVTPGFVVPVPNEFAQDNLQVTTKEIPVNSPSRSHRVKKQKIRKVPSPAMEDQESAQEESSVNQAYFAEHNIENNYSNEQAAGMNKDPIPAIPGTPYIPSMSLSYEALPEVMAADSLRYVDMMNGINDVLAVSRIKDIACLNKLQTEMERSKKTLKQAELKNRNFILLDKKNARPLLLNIHRQMKTKEKKIDQLRIQLQSTEEEIIHI